MFYRFIVSISVALILTSCAQSALTSLSFPFSEPEINIDAALGRDEWAKAVTLNGLIAPWENDNPDQTKFKAFISENYFNFIFQVEDNTLITQPFEKELSVAGGDRVELFFASNRSLNNYYCVEMDPNGNILDYSAENYRKFNEQWDFSSIEVSTKTTESGYVVEGKIALLELENLGIGNSFYLGVFRADFKNSKSKEVSWYSWVKPQKSSPDFHIPSAFGKVSFAK
ncbi:MAG: hypothetical protein GYB55_02015 [Cytophagales bacterium]|uniref:carbohydrate-binding family 9-like protein n=1 Tax=Cyclobacterium marinum TaxID=104 RepID=UPI0030D76D4E|nr:hypothetical protein [Cytophagales bacterium]|tara:strand:- start:73384 stop:74064 length:681 start_codon:yes stop_codon:yes gene_type:complete